MTFSNDEMDFIDDLVDKLYDSVEDDGEPDIERVWNIMLEEAPKSAIIETTGGEKSIKIGTEKNSYQFDLVNGGTHNLICVVATVNGKVKPVDEYDDWLDLADFLSNLEY